MLQFINHGSLGKKTFVFFHVILIGFFLFDSTLTLAGKPRIKPDTDAKHFPELFHSKITRIQKVQLQNFGSIQTIRHTPQGDYFITGHANPKISGRKWGVYNGGINIWEAETLNHVGVLAGHRDVSSLDFTPDGNTLVSASEDHTIRMWDVFTRQAIRIIEDHKRFYYSIRVLPTGDTFLVGGSEKIGDSLASHILRKFFGSPYYLQLRDLSTGEVIQDFKGHSDTVTALRLSPDGNSFSTVGYDGTVRTWNPHTGQHSKLLFQTETGDFTSALSYSKDGNLLAVGAEKKVRIIESGSGEILQTLEGPYQQIDFLMDDNFLLAYGPPRLVIWDLTNNTPILDISRKGLGKNNPVVAHSLSPRGDTLVLATPQHLISVQLNSAL